MTPCPDPAVLEGLFEATLSAEDRAAVERHLDACARCSATVAELARLFGSATWGSAIAGPNPVTPSFHPTRDGDPSSAAEFGRYRLGPRLGVGGMGMVFEAEDRELHRRVALKILHADPNSDVEQTRARLLREARAMARTAHPNVVTVYDVGRVGEQVFLAMELIEGATLSEWLRPGRARAEILATFVDAGRGLEAAHGAGLVHRDFKPDNVLVASDGRVRVTDFGLALAGEVGVASATTDLRASMQIQSEHGAIVGTPAYMAPEQWRGQPADARSDQFSFCVALYEALFGARPFVGDSVATLARAVLEGQPPAPKRGAPRWLQAALLRGLSRDAAGRFASMTELLAVLERDRSRPRRLLGVAAAMGFGGLVAAGVFAWASGQTSDAPAPAPEFATPSPVAAIDELAPPSRACEVEVEQGRGAWSRARREAVRAHLGAIEGGAATVPLLDAWLARWAALAKAHCDPEAALEHRDAQRRCLDEALARFDAMVQRISELGEFELAGALPGATSRLPELERCVGPGWLSLIPSPPAAELAGKATLVGKDLAAVEISLALERWVAAQREAAGVVAAAEALGHAPLLAEAQLARGWLDAVVGETDLAIANLEAAAETAEAAGHERVLGLAALALVEQLGVGQLRHEDAKRWLRVVSGLGARLGDAGLRGRALLAEAQALAAVAEHREALAKLDDAEPLLRERYGDQHPLLVELELARADANMATAELDDARRAAERAESLAIATLGPAALTTARAKAARARIAFAREQLDDATVLATAASKIPGVGRSRRHDLDRGLYLGLLGDIAVAQGDLAAALERYETAKIYLYAGPESALPLLWQGAAHLRLGQIDAGVALIDAGWVQLDEHWAEDDLRRASLLRRTGLAALEVREFTRARADLERARDLVEQGLGFGPMLAGAEADLGKLERAAGRPREALELLDSSYVGMVAGIGQRHPWVLEITLARADLAWELDDREYAGGLYRAIHDEVLARYGAADPASARAAARRSQPD